MLRHLALLIAAMALSRQAMAADSSELWPELSAFFKITPQTRVYLDASYARGKESDTRSLDLTGAVDVSLQPLFREYLRGVQLPAEDWQRSRYLWTRIGYTRVLKSSDGSTSVASYDTRYHGLSRMLYQPGAEITIDPHFRLELYYARQEDRLPERESVNALGLVAKWYY